MAREHTGPATAVARGLQRLETEDWRRIEAAAFHAEPEVLACLSALVPTRLRRWLGARDAVASRSGARGARLTSTVEALPAARLAAIREDLLRAIAELRNRQLIDDATAVRAAEAPPGLLAQHLAVART